MAFSGSTDFTYTRDQIIKAALRKCRAYDAESGAPEAYQTRDAAEALNLIAKSFALAGSLLWRRSQITINLVKGKRSYTIGASGDLTTTRPLRVYNPIRRNISTKEDVPLTIEGRADYDLLTNKFTTGVVSSVYFDRQITDAELFVWPVPDTSTYQIIAMVELEIEDFDSSGDDANAPSYAYNYFVWQLAAELAPEYGLTEEMKVFEQKAQYYRNLILEFEEEADGFQLVPDATCYR